MLLAEQALLNSLPGGGDRRKAIEGASLRPVCLSKCLHRSSQRVSIEAVHPAHHRIAFMEMLDYVAIVTGELQSLTINSVTRLHAKNFAACGSLQPGLKAAHRSHTHPQRRSKHSNSKCNKRRSSRRRRQRLSLQPLRLVGSQNCSVVQVAV